MYRKIKGFKPPKKWSLTDPYVRELCKVRINELKPTLFHYVDHWAATRPNEIAIVEYDTGEKVTWAKFAQASKAFAARLAEYGLQKGDIIATSLPFLKEHVYLMIGCMRLGVIFAPLDLRLSVREINQCFEKIRPKMYFFLGLTPVKDFRPMIEELMKTHSKKNGGSVSTWIQFQKSSKGVIKGAVHAKEFAARITFTYLWNAFKEFFGYGVYLQEQNIQTRDACMIIFTTGSTGQAKPALLHHHGILLQNLALDVAFFVPATKAMKKRNKDKGTKDPFSLLVNLPPSHVAGSTEQLFTGIFVGVCSVVLHIFDAKKSLDAIQKYKCTAMGQIPACFNLQWALEDYDTFDLSSLEIGIYGGQGVNREFLVKMAKMTKRPGSSYGLTELNGCVTFTNFDTTPDEIMQGIGWDTPCCRISIRKPVKESGKAGDELPAGEVGEICCEGDMVFAGYYGMPEVTSKAICEDESGVRIYYTGDLGSYNEKGLHFESRRKFVLKPKGYQVFPPEVEDVFSKKFEDEILFICCVGIEHGIFSQGIVAVIKFAKGSENKVSIEMLQEHAKKELASYKRPSLYVFLGEDEEFPLNRSRKRDYMAVTKIAEEHVKKLRLEGGWDVVEKKKE